jgi:hypothetical protein
MRKFAIGLVLLAFLPAGLAAQGGRTLVGPEMESGGFGGFATKFTSMRGDFAVLLGGRGGWIINRTLVLGGGGYGLVSDIWTDVYDQYNRPGKLRMGYGGLDLEVLLRSDDLVHLTLQGLIGGGGVTYRFDSVHPSSWDAVFVAEPGVNLELNVTHFMRISAGGSYRFVQDVDLVDLTNQDVSGWAGTLLFKFGVFGRSAPRSGKGHIN